MGKDTVIELKVPGSLVSELRGFSTLYELRGTKNHFGNCICA